MTKLTANQKQLLERLFDIGAICFGAFKVKHHEQFPDAPLTPFYINFRLLRSDHLAMKYALKECYRLTQNLTFDYIADIPTAITPLAAIWSYEKKIPLITCRPPKKHGLRVSLDGIYEPGKTALLIDDLITQGTSKIEPVARLREAGLTVHDLAVIIDREQGGVDTMKKVDVTLHAALPITQVFAYYRRTERISAQTYQEVRDYLALPTE